MTGKSQMATPSLKDFERDVIKVAGHFTKGGVDPRGRDFDDYANHLRFAAWRASKRPSNNTRAFIRRAIWNAAKDLARQAYRCSIPTSELREEIISTDPYPRINARLDLQKVLDETPEVLNELVLVMCEGSPCHAFTEGSKSTKYRRHASNVARAREVLKGS